MCLFCLFVASFFPLCPFAAIPAREIKQGLATKRHKKHKKELSASRSSCQLSRYPRFVPFVPFCGYAFSVIVADALSLHLPYAERVHLPQRRRARGLRQKAGRKEAILSAFRSGKRDRECAALPDWRGHGAGGGSAG